ncbi:24015_t:CDS:1, partial [Racocetra persica]
IVLNNGLHYLKQSSEHIYAPQASRSEVVKAVAKIKKCVLETRKKPTQLIQDNMNSIPEEVRPYMPTLSALRRVVTRAQKNKGLQELQSASDLILPPSLCNTLGGNTFLVKDHK